MTAKLHITPASQFRCDCGNEVVRAVSAVKRSRSISCGCSRGNGTTTGYTGVIKNKRKYQAQIKRNSDTNLQVTVTAGAHSMRVVLDAASIRNPFTRDELAGFRCGVAP